jgi:glutaredoxin
MFALESCGYCQKAKELFNSKGITPKIIYVNKNDNSWEEVWKQYINQAENSQQNYSTFPRIFKNNRFIGGFGDLETYFNSNANNN